MLGRYLLDDFADLVHRQRFSDASAPIDVRIKCANQLRIVARYRVTKRKDFARSKSGERQLSRCRPNDLIRRKRGERQLSRYRPNVSLDLRLDVCDRRSGMRPLGFASMKSKNRGNPTKVK